MFWGNKSIGAFSEVVPGLVSSGAVSNILGFNEPQTPGQSELSAVDGAALWKQYIEPLKQQKSSVRLGSPAPSNAESGKVWIQDFIGNCTGGCTLDFIALHWYYINATSFIDYLTDFHDTFQKPIWVTEWACENFADSKAQCSDAEIATFMNETQSFMDNTDWVERYAWFGAFRTMPSDVNPALALLDKDGKITPLGKQYIGSTSNDSGSGGGGSGGGLPPVPSGTNAALRVRNGLCALLSTLVGLGVLALAL